jgi:hypothetical protein
LHLRVPDLGVSSPKLTTLGIPLGGQPVKYRQEGGPVEGCWVVEGTFGTTLRVPVKDSQLAVAEQQSLLSKSSRILTGFGGFYAENNPGM